MKKQLTIVLSFVVILGAIFAWSVAYAMRKNTDNLPTLATIVEMSEAEVNSLLPGYKINQLMTVWGEPDFSEDSTASWKIGDVTLIVNYKNNGVVAICGLKDENGASVEENQDIAEPESYAFEVQYIRTDGDSEDKSFPYCVVIDSRQELEDYYLIHKEQFDLERRKVVYSDTSIGFLDACDKYDETYFESNNLVFIILEEGSGSIRHEITDVRVCRDENGAPLGWNITIDRIVPEVGTDDMAQWHLLLEVQMGNIINEEDSIWVNGKLCETKKIN